MACLAVLQAMLSIKQIIGGFSPDATATVVPGKFQSLCRAIQAQMLRYLWPG